MQKPYAESTLRKKYRETAIDHSLIDLVKDYLNACAFFYYILEIDEVWKIIQNSSVITKEQFDTLLPILRRDDSLECVIIEEADLYSDGAETLLLVLKKYLYVPNKDCDLKEYARHLDDLNGYDGPPPVIVDWDRVIALDRAREGKRLFVPDNLLDYALKVIMRRPVKLSLCVISLRKESCLRKMHHPTSHSRQQMLVWRSCFGS